MLSTKNLLRLAANTVLGVALILLWLKFVDVNEVMHQISKVSAAWIIPVFFCLFFSILLRSIRLKILLSKFKLPLTKVFMINMLSQFLSFFIPLRAGEIAKSAYISTHYNTPFSNTLVWILMDRFLDFWAVFVICLIMLILVSVNLPPGFVPVLLISIVAMTSGVALMVYYPKLLKSIVRMLAPLLFLEPLKKLLFKVSDFFIEQAVFLKRDTKSTIAIITLTLAALITDGIIWFVIFIPFFGWPVDFFRVQLGTQLSALTYIIPAAPGYVGSAEAYSLAVFSLFLGYDKTLVSAVAVLIHAVTVIAFLAGGILSLYILKFNLDIVWKKLKR